MSNPRFSNRKLVIAFSSAFMTQTAFGAAIATANLDARHPQTTPAFHAIIPFREESRECSQEHVTIERLTGKIARFTFAFDFTSKLAAGWYAYLDSVAAAPTGTPADEVQSIALGGATSGTFRVGFDFEGVAETSTTALTATTVTAAQIQAALEALISIKKGNVSVSGSVGGPFTVTFLNRLAKANLPLITIVDNTAGGTGVAVTQTTAGANKVHLITRTTSEQPVLFSLMEYFDAETGACKRYKDFVVNSWSVTATRRGKPALTVEAFGNPDPEIISGYSTPACVTEAPIRTGDIRFKVGNEYVAGDTQSLTYTESNNIDVSEDALRFDDVTPDRLERGDRTASLNATIIGSPTSTLYDFAEDEDNAFAALEIAFGRPGERLTILAPNTQFRLDDSLVTFVSARNKSAFQLIGRPSPDGSSIVTRGEYHGAFTGRFLLDT
jgi:hypothetical protein